MPFAPSADTLDRLLAGELTREEVQARLRESEEQFRSFAESLSDVAFVVDAEGAPLWWNARHEELFGEGQGMAHVAEMCHPDEVERVMGAWMTAAVAGDAVHIDCRLMCVDGGYRPFQSHVTPVKDPSGKVLRWCGLCRDVSEQHRRERLQSFLLSLGEALRHETAPEGVLRESAERVGRLLGTSRAGYADIDADAGVISIAHDWCAEGLTSIAGRHPLNPEFVSLGAYSTGRTQAIGDFLALPDVGPQERAALDAVAIRASLTVPLLKQGRLVAIFTASHSAPRAWTPEEISVVEEVAERTWAALERVKAEARLRESEEQFRGLAENLPHLCWVGSAADGRILWANAHWHAFYADYPKTLEGDPTGSIHPDDVDEAMGKWAEGRRTGAPVTAIVRMRGGPDNSYRPFHSFAAPILGDDRRVLRWCGIQTDLTEQHAREARQAFLFDLAEALRHEPDPHAQLSLASRRLADFLDADVVGFSELDPAGQIMTNGHECARGVLPGFAGELRVDAFGPSRAMAALTTGVALMAPDVARDLADDAMCAPCLEFGVRAAIAVPVYVEGRFRAILYVDHSQPMPWGETELQLVREVADRTWASSERSRAEAARRESEALLASIMDHAPVGIYVKDLDGRYVLVNPEMSKLLGRPAGELIGLRARDVVDAEYAEEVETHDRWVMDTGQTHVSERKLGYGQTGSYDWSLITRFPVSPSAGAPRQVAGINVNLSAQKAAEAELERSREALYQSEKLTALGSLLAGVSHELNNPLSIVVAQAVMMERQAAGGPLVERAKQIRAAADRCARIVQTFLAMARQRKPQRRRVHLNEVVDAALELTAYGLRTGGVQVVREQTLALPPISADADQLHQVIINLVINAQQAMSEQAHARTLTVRTGAADGGASVVLEIADNGPGVPDELRRRIFEPFFTTKPQEVGTGVGLSFSQGLVEAHEGRLELLETPCSGATFRVTLPTGVADEPIVAPAAMVAAAATGGRTALVVDDEPQIARALAEFLEFEGYACDVAISGAEAKLRLASADYDLIVSDLRMPDVDGPTLFAWIKAERPELAKRVAFATGDTLGAPAVRFLAREGRPFMEKPFTPESLRTLLAEVEEFG